MDCEGLLCPLMFLVLLGKGVSATRDDCFRSEEYGNARKGKGHKISSFLRDL